MMCGFDAECVAIVANVRFFLRFFLIIATIVTHLRQKTTHSVVAMVYLDTDSDNAINTCTGNTVIRHIK